VETRSCHRGFTGSAAPREGGCKDSYSRKNRLPALSTFRSVGKPETSSKTTRFGSLREEKLGCQCYLRGPPGPTTRLAASRPSIGSLPPLLTTGSTQGASSRSRLFSLSRAPSIIGQHSYHIFE
jgi:hypothetical protein